MKHIFFAPFAAIASLSSVAAALDPPSAPYVISIYDEGAYVSSLDQPTRRIADAPTLAVSAPGGFIGVYNNERHGSTDYVTADGARWQLSTAAGRLVAVNDGFVGEFGSELYYVTLSGKSTFIGENAIRFVSAKDSICAVFQTELEGTMTYLVPLKGSRKELIVTRAADLLVEAPRESTCIALFGDDMWMIGSGGAQRKLSTRPAEAVPARGGFVGIFANGLHYVPADLSLDMQFLNNVPIRAIAAPGGVIGFFRDGPLYLPLYLDFNQMVELAPSIRNVFFKVDLARSEDQNDAYARELMSRNNQVVIEHRREAEAAILQARIANFELPSDWFRQADSQEIETLKLEHTGCPVCLTPFEEVDAEQIVRTNCGHYYCRECLRGIACERDGQCSACRRQVSEAPETIVPRAQKRSLRARIWAFFAGR